MFYRVLEDDGFRLMLVGGRTQDLASIFGPIGASRRSESKEVADSSRGRLELLFWVAVEEICVIGAIFARGVARLRRASLNSLKINVGFTINPLTGISLNPMGCAMFTGRPLQVVVSNASATFGNFGSPVASPC